MGFFDKFKSKFARVGEMRRPKQSKQKTAAEVIEVERETTAPALTAHGTTGAAYRTLLKPLVTEKTATLAHGRKYVFVVSQEATKLSVKQAVRELYGVLPESVRMINREGKAVHFGARNGERKDWKKAIVTVPEGKTLPIYE